MLFLIYHYTIVTKTNIIHPMSKKDPSIQKESYYCSIYVSNEVGFMDIFKNECGDIFVACIRYRKEDTVRNGKGFRSN